LFYWLIAWFEYDSGRRMREGERTGKKELGWGWGG
jgi:hypothetical protein